MRRTAQILGGTLTLVAAPTLALAATSPDSPVPHAFAQASEPQPTATILDFTMPWNAGRSHTVDLG